MLCFQRSGDGLTITLRFTRILYTARSSTAPQPMEITITPCSVSAGSVSPGPKHLHTLRCPWAAPNASNGLQGRAEHTVAEMGSVSSREGLRSEKLLQAAETRAGRERALLPPRWWEGDLGTSLPSLQCRHFPCSSSLACWFLPAPAQCHVNLAIAAAERRLVGG